MSCDGDNAGSEANTSGVSRRHEDAMNKNLPDTSEHEGE